ncbi:lantibiotic dehydratase [Caldimonas brevitalea]|uniref:Lanthionine biosynthesis protein LanB n=1 Tax=Caldimonas brevitalea TaxID=413882 RepID=A0A0G3BSZ2_9BURK|nr:lantibiotic dehydratase [Caldimonas brevitalea]AKJ29650.1 lanthionine biosynthesis protein LanB [Caldimonas brevitalea]
MQHPSKPKDVQRAKPGLRCAGFFVLRTPALPWDEIHAWSAELSARRTWDTDGALADALALDRQRLRQRLRSIIQRAEVQAALEVASPGLCHRLGPWLAGSPGRAALQLEATLVRYLMRMAGRATPFGLFAGTSTGRLSDRVHLVVPPRRHHVRHTRLDLEHVLQLAAHLSQDPSLRSQLRFIAASSVYEVAGRWRYHELRLQGRTRSCHLVDVEPTGYLRVVLQRAGDAPGATLDELAQALCAQFDDVDLTQAHDYLLELVDAGLLRSPLDLVLTGPDPVQALADRLRELPDGRVPAATLDEVQDALGELDRSRDDDDTRRRRLAHVEARLRSLPGVTDPARLLRIDLHKPGGDPQLSHRVADEVAAGAELLARLAVDGHERALDDFVHRFEQRYGDREVPLLEALDEDGGLGFGDDGVSATADTAPLLDGWAFAPQVPAAPAWTRRDAVLLRRLGETLQQQALEMELTEDDLHDLTEGQRPQLPPGMGVLVTLAPRPGAALAEPDYTLHLRRCLGPSSVRLLGRFCQGDAELERLVRAALRAEEACDPDAVHAEVVHLPQGRAGNVMARPVLREYEIPVLDPSGAPQDRQLPLSDLLVSVDRGRIQLRSARLDRRVLPHLSCAHAWRRSSCSAYRFLVSLAAHGSVEDAGFSWGALADAPFLPRVVQGRLVLSLATWNLAGREMPPEPGPDDAAHYAALQMWRARLKLPRFVCLEDGDLTLPVDLDNCLSLDSLVQQARRRASVRLCEMFPPPSDLVAEGEQGHYVHELVVPCVRAAAVAAPAFATSAPRWRHEEAGDDEAATGWLYLKLYCSVAAQDRLLCEVLRPAIAALRREPGFDRWFFVRYADPAPHLRLRLRGTPAWLWREAAPRLFAACGAAGDCIRSIATDRYVPELVRYGGPAGLDLCEQLFEADSDATVALIAGERNTGDRWRLALLGIAAWLEAFRFDPVQRRDVARACRDTQLTHFAGLPDLQRRLGATCRRHRAEVQALLDTPPPHMRRAAQTLSLRTQAATAAIAGLQQLAAAGRLSSSLPTLAGHLVHMSAHRMFRHAANLQELVLYDLLCRAWDARLQQRQQAEATDLG